MLKHKALVSLIILGFTYFLSEYLTWTTLLFILLSSGVWLLNLRLPRPLRFAAVIALVGSYALIYGKIFDPEVGLNFLTSVLMLKVLESETDRDGFMVFFGLILLISAGSIFEKSLEYTLYMLGSFLFLLRSFHRDRKIRWAPKEILVTLALILPLVGVLFFVVPRIMNPIGLFRPQNQKGKIGFSKSVTMEDVESLTPSDETAFYAVITEAIPRDELYWRGNTLTLSDGWNWNESPSSPGKTLMDESFDFRGVKQEIYLTNPGDYFFLLDWPLALRTELRDQRPGDSGSLPQDRFGKVKNYTVWSQKSSPEDADLRPGHRKSGLRPVEKSWVRERFATSDPMELLREIREYFQQEGYSYTLSPGKVRSLTEFRQVKLGFCTHFASATAQILRAKGVPARLVSGYMGGLYNQFGNYFQITENDAHVWVEVGINEKWLRIDPTAWISPDRVSLGGDAYIKERVATEGQGFRRLNPLRSLGIFQDLRLEFERLNFLFYRTLEEMNYFSQLTLLQRLGLSRKLTFILIPGIVLLFCGLYFFFIYRQRRKPNLEALAWKRLGEKLGSRLEQSPNSLAGFRSALRGLEDEKRLRAETILQKLEGHSYGGKETALGEVLREIGKL